ncbi:hypothetical protein SPRG_21043, partial [Saprolegnia parasitica CBS 223.65]
QKAQPRLAGHPALAPGLPDRAVLATRVDAHVCVGGRRQRLLSALTRSCRLRQPQRSSRRRGSLQSTRSTARASKPPPSVFEWRGWGVRLSDRPRNLAGGQGRALPNALGPQPAPRAWPICGRAVAASEPSAGDDHSP